VSSAVYCYHYYAEDSSAEAMERRERCDKAGTRLSSTCVVQQSSLGSQSGRGLPLSQRVCTAISK